MPAGLLMMLALGSVPLLPAEPDLLRLGGALVVGGTGYLAIVGVTRTREVAAVVPFCYTRLVFAMLPGALIFGERPGPLMLAGAVLVVRAGLYTIWRETVIRHQRGRPGGQVNADRAARGEPLIKLGIDLHTRTVAYGAPCGWRRPPGTQGYGDNQLKAA